MHQLTNSLFLLLRKQKEIKSTRVDFFPATLASISWPAVDFKYWPVVHNWRDSYLTQKRYRFVTSLGSFTHNVLQMVPKDTPLETLPISLNLPTTIQWWMNEREILGHSEMRRKLKGQFFSRPVCSVHTFTHSFLCRSYKWGLGQKRGPFGHQCRLAHQTFRLIN